MGKCLRHAPGQRRKELCSEAPAPTHHCDATARVKCFTCNNRNTKSLQRAIEAVEQHIRAAAAVASAAAAASAEATAAAAAKNNTNPQRNHIARAQQANDKFTNKQIRIEQGSISSR
jgi:hypothetical protein